MLPFGYPKNREVEAYLKIIRENKVSAAAVREMDRQIKSGMVRGIRDWKNPDEWINERLTGVAKETALLIWEGSGQILYPLHNWAFMKLLGERELVIKDAEGVYKITDRGKDFASNREGKVVREIDEEEGLVFILYLISEMPGLKRTGHLSIWSDFVIEVVPKWKKSGPYMGIMLKSRLNNLEERGLLNSEGLKWSITTYGRSYLETFDVVRYKRFISKRPPPVLEPTETRRRKGKMLPYREASDHDLTQLRLVELGYLMGFAVYVARSDKSKVIKGVPLADYDEGELPARGLKRELTEAMANIDIIWFEPETKMPVAFIEIETTTGFVKNLQKIQDLLSEVPPGYAHSAGVYIVGYDRDREVASRMMWGVSFRGLEEQCREYKFISVEDVTGEYEKLERRLKWEKEAINKAEKKIKKSRTNIEKIKNSKFSLFALS